MGTRADSGHHCTGWAIVVVVALAASACASGGEVAEQPAADAVELRQPSQAELVAAGFDGLPLAPSGDRLDVEMPVFTHPTTITNPLFPISELQSVVFSGEVEGLPFHTETTLLPETRLIEWREGQVVETSVSQYFAYLDGRVEEVALDYYAQADDGSVWYFGEDLWDFGRQGFVVSTEGAWLAGREGPPAMIMPALPVLGDVFRAENTPPVAFEELTVSAVDETTDGPVGPVEGAMVASELHLDGSTSDKVFAPGYGEFFSDHDGDLEALALAVPTDALDEAMPTELAALETAAATLFDDSRAGDFDSASATVDEVTQAWTALEAAGTPPLLADEMNRAVTALEAAVAAGDPVAAGNASIDLAQATLDQQLRYRAQPAIDLGRFELWARQLVVDAEAEGIGGLRGDVTTMEWIRDRFATSLDPVDLIAIDLALMDLRNAVNDRDLDVAVQLASELRDHLQGVQIEA